MTYHLNETSLSPTPQISSSLHCALTTAAAATVSRTTNNNSKHLVSAHCMPGTALSVLHALQQPCEAGLLHVSIWHMSNNSVRGYGGDCVHLQSPSSCPPCHICNLWNYLTTFWLRHQTVSSAKMGSMLDRSKRAQGQQ